LNLYAKVTTTAPGPLVLVTMAEPKTDALTADSEDLSDRKPRKFATFKRAVGSKLTSAVKGTNNTAGAISRGTKHRMTAAIQHIKEGVNKTKKERNDTVPNALEEDVVDNPDDVNESVFPEDEIGTKPNADNNDVVTLGPFLEFITADTTLLCIFTLAAAVYPTFEYWDNIWNPQATAVAPLVILFKVGLPWMMVAFTLGLSLGQYMEDYRWILPMHYLTKGSSQPSMNDRTHLDSISEAEEEGERQGELESHTPDTVVAKHSLFITLLGKKRSERIQFRHPITIPPKVKAWTTLRTTTSSSSHETGRSFHLPWQHNISPTDDGFLMQNLLKHSSFRRTRISTDVVEQSDFLRQESTNSTHLGSFDLSSTVADSLEGFVVEPIFQLRGMDVFLTDDPEPQASTHPWLIEQGLRSVPTFIVNVLTQWGNILIYFEMPTWVHGFQHAEEVSDPDHVKALKASSSTFVADLISFLQISKKRFCDRIEILKW
jgi:hypothetical protein